MNVFDTEFLNISKNVYSFNNVYENGSHYLNGSSSVSISKTSQISFKHSLFRNCVSYQETPCVAITDDDVNSGNGKNDHIVRILIRF